MPFNFVVNPNSTLATFQWEVPAGNNGGLAVTIQNALLDLWQDEFSRAVAEWDAGMPDALTLTVEGVPLEPECQALKGRIKSKSTASPVSIIKLLKRLTKLHSLLVLCNGVHKHKVCDGDYGVTKWRGITAIIVSQRDFMVGSTVRINNFLS